MGTKEKELYPIFRGGAWEAEVVRAKLMDAGIVSMVKDDAIPVLTSQYLNPQSVIVLVSEEDVTFAKQLLEEKSE